MTHFNSENNKKIIVVARGLRDRRMLAGALQDRGYAVVEHSMPGDVLGSLGPDAFAIVVDVAGDVDRGAATVQRLANLDTDVPVIAVAHDDKAWLSTVNVGALDCVVGAFDAERLGLVIDRAVERRALLLRVTALERKYRAVQSAVQDEIDGDDLEAQFGEGTDVRESGHDGDGAAKVVPLRVLEDRAIKHAMEVTNGSVTKAARLLGIGRATLYRRLANDRN